MAIPRALRRTACYAAPLVLAGCCWWPWAPDGPFGARLAPFGFGVNQLVLTSILVHLLPFSETVQTQGCRALRPPPSVPDLQYYSGFYLNGLKTATRAMRAFPSSRDLQAACIGQLASTCLFNAATSDVAGELGAVELALKGFKTWPHDASMQSLGDLGCFFDFSDKNRARFREANGLEYVKSAIEVHYQNAWVQFMAWCAYSSGCQGPNPDRCADIGVPELGVQVMKDHRGRDRVREEVMQSVKGALVRPKYHARLLGAGFVEQVVDVMRERPDSMTDQSVGCECLRFFAAIDHYELGPNPRRNFHWPGPEGLPPGRPLNASRRAELQDIVAQKGALEAIARALDLESQLSLGAGFGGQNQEALQQYNIGRECMEAIAVLAFDNRANQRALVRLGAPEKVARSMRLKPGDTEVQANGCAALKALSEDDGPNHAAVKAAKPPFCPFS